MNRAVSFEYMNRQLVWNEFSVNLFLVLVLSDNRLYICVAFMSNQFGS
jgi:hypothetical protein